MSELLTMPKLSPTMEVGMIARWLVSEGQLAKAGCVLFEVATDKATIEYPSLDPVYVRKILVPEGQSVKVGDPVAIVSATLEEEISFLEQTAHAHKDAAMPEEETTPKATPEPTMPLRASAMSVPSIAWQAAGPLKNYQFDPSETQKPLRVSPYARKLAEARGLELAGLEGSGPGGRIVAADLEGAAPVNEWGIQLDNHPTPLLPPGSFELDPLTPMRRAIATRLQASKASIPHFYLEIDLEVTSLHILQQQLKSEGIRVSLNDLIARACAMTLRRHGEINVGYDSVEDKIIRFKTIDLSIAVAVEGGLITPILFHADYLTLGQISRKIRLLAKRASQGDLKPYEYQGGSFTLSNLGMYGVHRFHAIINPPQGAILAVGAIQQRPVVRDGICSVGNLLTLALSCDHRVIDGAAAARFLQSLSNLLQKPALLLV